MAKSVDFKVFTFGLALKIFFSRMDGMENEISNLQIEKKIFVIRGVQVMVDRDIAELKSIRQHQIETDVHLNESDKKIDQLFTLMDKYNVKDTQGIFFQGQIFDAYAKYETFIQAAKKEIILSD